jgi:RNA polymerase sigma factor (sigma-70 family)
MLQAPSIARDLPRPASDPFEGVARAAACGDLRAVHSLIVSLTPTFLRAAMGVLGASHPELEDVVQESALGLVSALPGFRYECKIRHFAARIAVLTALKARRHLRSRSDAYAEPVGQDDLPFQEASPADAVHLGRRRQVLRSLFEELPEPQSEALVLHFVLEFTVDEIAHATAAPIDTVRSRLRLAKKALRERIAADPMLRDALEVLP